MWHTLWKFTRWCLRLSEFASDIVHSVELKYQAVDELSKLSTAWTEKPKLDGKIPVLKNPRVFRTLYSVKVQQEEKEPKDYGTPQGNSFPFLPKVFAPTEKTEETKPDMPNLHQFITDRTAKNECPLAEASVWQPKMLFSYDGDRVLVKKSSLGGASSYTYLLY